MSAGNVRAHWLHGIITARAQPPLILMQCDKMQSVVKKGRKVEEVII